MSTSHHDASPLSQCTTSMDVSAQIVQESCPVDKRPGLPITIFNVPFNVLLDTGASISAISEQTFASIKQRMPEGTNMCILPVTGVTITTAVHGRSRKIMKQVLLPFSIYGHLTDCICLIVPHLATSIIFGDD